MTVLAVGKALLRQWFREPVSAGEDARDGSLAIDLVGTFEIVRAEDDRIEASIVGRIRVVRERKGAAARGTEDGRGHHGPTDPDLLPAETQVDARCRSQGALADARPFVWLQLLDDRGAVLTHEVLLGRGDAIEHQIHARIVVPTRAGRPLTVEPAERAGSTRRVPGCSRQVSGLRARVVARTYRNASGPRYQEEILMFDLLAAGALVPETARAPLPPAAPARPSLPARLVPAPAARG